MSNLGICKVQSPRAAFPTEACTSASHLSSVKHGRDPKRTLSSVGATLNAYTLAMAGERTGA